MAETNSTQPVDKNENIMAALAHATALIPVMGVIAPIIIWTTQKDKSERVAFQALQATAYQFVMIIAWLFGMIAYIASIPLMMVLMALGEKNFPMVGAFFPMIVMLVIFVGGGIFIIYGVVATVMTFMGKDFRYVLLGKWLEKYIAKE